MGSFRLNDIGIKMFHPNIHLGRSLYLSLVERLIDYYPNQKMEAEKYSFWSIPQRIATVSQKFSTVTEVFDDDVEAVKSRFFKITNQVVVCAQLNVNYFDLVLSAVYMPSNFPMDYTFGVLDLVGKCFLKEVDFAGLEAEDISTGITWQFRRGNRNYSLKLEPHSGHPGQLFIDVVVFFPQEKISTAEMKLVVEEELEYLENRIFPFIRGSLEGERSGDGYLDADEEAGEDSSDSPGCG
ncbi:MAG: hypothetical protein D6805_08370 [Planctomycetota bacterium]|nr:MAG: hypothetical protein D6805_08370 [Planctomycetota bacterium]